MKPQGDRHAALARAREDVVRHALGEPGGDQFRGVRGSNHAVTLHSVGATRKRRAYTLCRDNAGPSLHSVGVLGPKFLNHVRAWREFREMSQEQLAEAAGCSPATVGHIETGARRLSDKWANAFAEVLKTRAGHLFDTDPESVATDVLDVWAEIPEENRAQALRVLQSFRTGTSS